MASDRPRRWRMPAHPEVPDAVGAALVSGAAELPHDSAVLNAGRHVPMVCLAQTRRRQRAVMTLGPVLFHGVGRALEIDGRSR